MFADMMLNQVESSLHYTLGKYTFIQMCRCVTSIGKHGTRKSVCGMHPFIQTRDGDLLCSTIRTKKSEEVHA